MAFTMYALVLVLLLTSQLNCMEAKSGFFGPSSTAKQETEVHIVYMGGASKAARTPGEFSEEHMDMLTLTLGSAKRATSSILYSYKNSFNGFAAVMTSSHAETLRGMDGVVSVFRSQIKQHHTTKSWEFLGLNPTSGPWPESDFGNGTIVGLLDTGIWPESLSFRDDGFGPIPARWKGSCEAGPNFTTSDCNLKLIGAKVFYKGYEAAVGNITAPEYKSPRDAVGHGSHTSSTATGRQVTNASFDGLANGTASGGAPSAWIAMYKVCFFEGCTDADILAGFEASISDGVDIISVSLGGIPVDYQSDTIAIGSFHAVEKGILVACSAGNSGPLPGSVSNLAPWIFTVAASSINRVFESTVNLVGGPSISGIAINTFTMNSSFPILDGASIPASPSIPSNSCDIDSLNATLAFGKIIVCHEPAVGYTDEYLEDIGAVGLVALSSLDQSVQFLPIVSTSYLDANTSTDKVLSFLNSTSNPLATISKSVSVFDSVPAPVMGYFSSVGPPSITPDIMKPDIAAPGVDIIAAWSPVASPSEDDEDKRVTNWNIISGTSMSCPHVAGTAALVKSLHPDWSPAAIKSAIMTTATPLNQSNPDNTVLASGSGQINPVKAVDPGLIFNTTITDYVNFLCSVGYNNTAVQLVTGGNQTCPAKPPSVLDMNYPSIYVSTNITAGFVHTITRTLTNVGPGSGSTTYSATSVVPEGVNLSVTPSELHFADINDVQSFTVTITATTTITGYNFGSITWKDTNDTHSVRLVVGIGQQGVYPIDY